jgi:hypothetical protein
MRTCVAFVGEILSEIFSETLSEIPDQHLGGELTRCGRNQTKG